MTDATPDIAARFKTMITGLCGVVAAHIANDRAAGDWIILVWNWLQRVGRHVERLSAQARAGTLPPQRAGFTRPKPRKPATRPPLVRPGHALWLIQVIQRTAVYGEILRRLLEDPEMAALLAAAPQLARSLRPLCRALGVTPPPLPPRPARPDPVSPDPVSPGPVSPDQAPPELATPLVTRPARPASPERPPRPRHSPISAHQLLKSA